MDIKSGNGYPASALSNFAPHPFEFDGVQIASMEGFLQSLKFKNRDMQEHICSLVGFAAKQAGRHKDYVENIGVQEGYRVVTPNGHRWYERATHYDDMEKSD